MDEFVEDEAAAEWEGKRVGERAVGKGEVAKAKICTYFYRDNFSSSSITHSFSLFLL